MKALAPALLSIFSLSSLYLAACSSSSSSEQEPMAPAPDANTQAETPDSGMAVPDANIPIPDAQEDISETQCKIANPLQLHQWTAT